MHRNRLPTIKLGDSMDKIDELTEMLRNAEGYMIGVTLYERGKLTHYLVTEKFPAIDMLKSHAKVKEQIIESMENERPVKDAPNP